MEKGSIKYTKEEKAAYNAAKKETKPKYRKPYTKKVVKVDFCEKKQAPVVQPTTLDRILGFVKKWL